jgi:hypothetical protein
MNCALTSFLFILVFVGFILLFSNSIEPFDESIEDSETEKKKMIVSDIMSGGPTGVSGVSTGNPTGSSVGEPIPKSRIYQPSNSLEDSFDY